MKIQLLEDFKSSRSLLLRLCMWGDCVHTKEGGRRMMNRAGLWEKAVMQWIGGLVSIETTTVKNSFVVSFDFHD